MADFHNAPDQVPRASSARESTTQCFLPAKPPEWPIRTGKWEPAEGAIVRDETTTSEARQWDGERAPGNPRPAQRGWEKGVRDWVRSGTIAAIVLGKTSVDDSRASIDSVTLPHNTTIGANTQ